MTRNIGYQLLIDQFDLDVCELLQISQVSERSQKDVVMRDSVRCVTYAESRIRVGLSWQENLIFALRYEGVNLEVLKALFAKIDRGELIRFIEEIPLGFVSRRVWFLYEWLTNDRLPIDDVKSGNYITVADGRVQVVLPITSAIREKRYRVLNNLVGSSTFCPLVRLTDKMRFLPTESLKEKINDVMRQYPAELIHRAVRYLYVKETKSSFAIERETPSQRRTETFVAALGHISSDPMDEATLVRLQNQLVDVRYGQSAWRKDQVYVGETTVPGQEKIHFIAVKPQDLQAIMSSFLEVLERWLSAAGTDALVIAAVMSFAFVFIHPFDDGNGRLHRYLIHYVLSRCGFSSSGFVIPVSAVLLKRSLEYDCMLESFSRRVMAHLDAAVDEQGCVTVRNESVDFYRYIDYTPIVEGFQQILVETIETEFKAELDYLCEYDVIRRGMAEIVDLPERVANRFIRIVQQNGGKLSAAKRNMFAELTDEEVARLEAVVRR